MSRLNTSGPLRKPPEDEAVTTSVGGAYRWWIASPINQEASPAITPAASARSQIRAGLRGRGMLEPAAGAGIAAGAGFVPRNRRFPPPAPPGAGPRRRGPGPHLPPAG